jgi:hypothetical protein
MGPFSVQSHLLAIGCPSVGESLPLSTALGKPKLPAGVASAPEFGVDYVNVFRGDFVKPFLKKVAWLCLLLTFWSALAFVYHHHSSTSEAAQCNVCVAAHSASPATVSHLVHATFVALSVFRAEPLALKQRLVVFALSVRPPPAV